MIKILIHKENDEDYFIGYRYFQNLMNTNEIIRKIHLKLLKKCVREFNVIHKHLLEINNIVYLKYHIITDRYPSKLGIGYADRFEEIGDGNWLVYSLLNKTFYKLYNFEVLLSYNIKYN